MSMKFENAQLRVRTITGRNGVFCVGDLQTALGSFKVKDPILDQFEEGSYEVDAWLDRIYLGQYVAYGRAVSEVRAQLADLQVIHEKRQDMPGEPEPDPMDEEAAQPAASPAPAEPASTPAKDEPGRDKRWDKFGKKKPEEPSAQPAAQAQAAAAGPAEESDVFDEALRLVVNNHEPVKLDPTVDRALFRRQTSELRAKGYTFNAKDQTWYAD